jgi:inosine/xanthosine triphosphatase
MKIAIASTNPVKINAVKKVFNRAFTGCRFVSLEINSGVKDQPTSDQETKRGAINRAKSALKKTQADMAVGLEGGVTTISGKMYCTAWAAVINKQGTLGLGGGMHFLIPDAVAKKVRQGHESGPVMDKISGITNIKKKGGMVEYFTKGLITRSKGYESLVSYALVEFRRPEIYRPLSFKSRVDA